MSSLNPVYKVGDQVAEGLLQHNKGMTKKKPDKKYWKFLISLESRILKRESIVIRISFREE